MLFFFLQLAALPDCTANADVSANQPSAAVVAHYESLAREKGSKAESQFDGIGTSVRIAFENANCVIRVREADGGSRVVVSYAAKPKDSAPVEGSSRPQAAQPQGPPGQKLYYADQRAKPGTSRALYQARAGVPPPLPVWSATPPLKLEWPSFLAAAPYATPGMAPSASSGKGCPYWTSEDPNARCLYIKFKSAASIKEIWETYQKFLPQYGYVNRHSAYEPLVNLVTNRATGGAVAHVEMYENPVKELLTKPDSEFPDHVDSRYERSIRVSISEEYGVRLVAITVKVKNGG